MSIPEMIALTNTLLALGATVFFYRVMRRYLWREYYLFNELTTDPSKIDPGDKQLALIFALAFGALWPLTIPAYATRRWLTRRRNQRKAQKYADYMMNKRRN